MQYKRFNWPAIALWPNNSFKPNLLRYTNNVTDKACHVAGSATQVGLTQALDVMKRLLVAVVFFSLLLGCQPAQVERVSWSDELQQEITERITIRDPAKVRSLIPYESISIERSPCFVSCPIYKMTLYRDGRAMLVDDHLLPEEARRYSAEIDLKDYARLAQFVEIARKGSKKDEYMGRWTDDYFVTITVMDSQGGWSVSDYGQVAPPEVWALQQLLFRQYATLRWAGGVK